MRISDWSSDVCSSDLAASPIRVKRPRSVAAICAPSFVSPSIAFRASRPIGYFLSEARFPTCLGKILLLDVKQEGQVMPDFAEMDFADDPRAALDRLLRDRRVDYAELSARIGRNPAYIQQYIKRGSPRRLAR